MGNGVGISRCQQNMKGILCKIDCQLIANERGRGGEGHKTITESFRGDQVNFIVTDPRSSVIPFIHEGTQNVCTVSIPESPLHFLRLF